jgi:type VI protein secretion system component VasA
MELPPTSRPHCAKRLKTNYHDPRLTRLLFAFIFLLARIDKVRRDFLRLRGM